MRSHPYSRYLPHFNKATLQQALEKENIYYVFLGKELGARPDNPACYIEGKAVYEKIASTTLFSEGVDRVLKGVQKHKIALMCAEKDPLTCHRAILVCQHLKNFDLEIKHILKNGELESHHHLEERMLAKHGFTQMTDRQQPIQLSLFDSESSPKPSNNLLPREEGLKNPINGKVMKLLM